MIINQLPGGTFNLTPKEKITPQAWRRSKFDLDLTDLEAELEQDRLQ